MLRLVNNANQWFILKSQEGYFSTTFGSVVPDVHGDGPIPGDFDGDGKWDIAVARGHNNDPYRYFVIYSSSNKTVNFFQWGLKTDQITLQDYDGDRKTDLAVYRYGGSWYILNSSDGSFRAEKFGSSDLGTSTEPIYGDYDGDGKADLTVASWVVSSVNPMPITFYIKRSSDGNWQSQRIGDRRGNAIVPGDYDGDGKTDIALWGGENFENGDGRWKLVS